MEFIFTIPRGATGGGGGGVEARYLSVVNEMEMSLPVTPFTQLIDLPIENVNRGFGNGNPSFFVEESGVYEISYGLHITSQISINVYVLQNGTMIHQSILSAPAGAADYIHTFLAVLMAGDMLSLAYEGIDLTSTMQLRPNVGAIMNVIRISPEM